MGATGIEEEEVYYIPFFSSALLPTLLYFQMSLGFIIVINWNVFLFPIF
jgi:hypothetical protein